MSVIFGLQNVNAEPQGRAVALGVFDGVHWGHRAIFERLNQVAVQDGLVAAAVTFDKHPAEILAPNRAPDYISTLDQRVELIRAIGVEQVVVTEFSHELAVLLPEEFLTVILRDIMDARHIVVGSNFRFGKDREGDVRYLATAAPALGMKLTTVSAVIINGGPVSSTRIRGLIGKGDVVGASKLLGRRFALRGVVVMGRQVGRTIGFPTANLQTSPRQLMPARGVYAVEATVGKSTYTGVCNIGCRPTYGGGDQSVEVHLSGFEGDVYGQTLDVIFCQRLRDEIAFDSPQSLVEQIKRDIERARGSCSDELGAS